MEDKTLITNVINNQPGAFQHLVEKHQNMVINTCQGFLHNYQDAQDVAQEVFIEVYRSIQKFRSESKLSTWLYRISVNKSLNYIRDNKKRSWFQSLDILFEIENKTNKSGAFSESPEEILENNERSTIVQNAIDKLATNQKVAFTLHKYENLSYSEIAEVMNTSLSSVESLIFRAKKSLQKHLLNYYKKNN